MRKIILLSFLLSSIFFSAIGQKLELPEIIVSNIEYEIEVVDANGINAVTINGQQIELSREGNKTFFTYIFNGPEELKFKTPSEKIQSYQVRPIPLWMSIIPPLLAIFFALLFREVITSLLVGIAFGSVCIGIFQSGFTGVITGLAHIVDHYVIASLFNVEHLSVIVFSLLIGGLVTLVSKNGGMQGVVDKLSRLATNARNGQLATFFLGIAIFFDDYANTLVVGNTMRPVTDKLGVSREKLSYIVDSTAAPVAAVAFITTWIGAELGYISSGISGITEMAGRESAYGIFLQSLQYAFYPLLTLAFIFMLIWARRDFGPMVHYEKMSRKLQQHSEEESVNLASADLDTPPSRWYNAGVPILALVVTAMIGLYYTGIQGLNMEEGLSFFRKISVIIGNSDPFKALLWASFTGIIVALILNLSQGILGIEKSVKALINGFETLLPAVLILVLAWSLAAITKDMHTADFLSWILKGSVGPEWIPALAFLVAALVSFATGSSWGTMAILYPLLLGTTWMVCSDGGMDYSSSMGIFLNVTSCILAGSVLGDHCSPISDTTILSSLATGTDHISHVKTQLPYALTVGAVGCIFGTIPASFGIHPLILFPICIAILYGIIQYFGSRTD